LTFYNKEDLKKGKVLSFMREGRKIDIGFMKFIVCSISDKAQVPKDKILPHIGKLCLEIEKGQYP